MDSEDITSQGGQSAANGNIFGEIDNTSGKKQDANIKVAVRCRPALEKEIKEGHTFEKLIVDPSQKGIR